jgi:hypothetical protein
MARAAGLDDGSIEVVSRAYRLAMHPRIASLDDDHHPAYLHPGRSAMILLRDVGPVAADALALAALLESDDQVLAVPLEEVRSAMGPALAERLAEIPRERDGRLLERLLLLDADATLAALAERLDHVRHAHMRGRPERWPALHEEALSVWLPLAERTHGRLADRFRNWARAFGRRLPRGP